jgi:hypothetical protein
MECKESERFKRTIAAFLSIACPNSKLDPESSRILAIRNEEEWEEPQLGVKVRLG